MIKKKRGGPNLTGSRKRSKKPARVPLPAKWVDRLGPWTASTFYCELDGLRETLERDGVAVIKGVLDGSECGKAFDLWWEWLQDLIIRDKKGAKQILRDDPSTWNLVQPYLSIKGHVGKRGVGQNAASWFVRSRPRVIAAFKEIWGTDDLLVSMDTVHFAPAAELMKKPWKAIGNPYPDVMVPAALAEELEAGSGPESLPWDTFPHWMHIDQSHEPGLQYIQGFVSMTDSGPHDGTLSVLVGSHKHHESFFAETKLTSDIQWFPLDQKKEHVEFFLNKGCEWCNVLVCAGDLVLWDSRTVHMGIQPRVPRDVPRTRFVVYVCMIPRERADDDDIKRRVEMYNKCLTTSHQPDKFRLAGGDDHVKPRGKRAVLNDRQKKLLGADPDRPS